MNQKFFIVRVSLDRASCKSRFKYNTENGGWANTFDQAYQFDSQDDAARRLRNRPGSIWSEADLKASPYYAAELESAASAKSSGEEKGRA